MRPTTFRTADGLRESREQRIGHFIARYLETLDDGRLDAVLVVARSGQSPVARALISASGAMVARGLEARIILGPEEAELESWPSGEAMDTLVREVRVVRDPRLLESHEQLVLGGEGVWFGDSMRRDPLQRDAHESFSPHDAAAARLARSMFERLWQLTLPLYPRAVGSMPPSARTDASSPRIHRGG